MNTYDLTSEIESAVEMLNSVKDSIEELPESLEAWKEIENEYGDAEDVSEQLRIHSDLSSALEYHDIHVDTDEGMQKLMSIIEASKKKDAVTEAIVQFVSTLSSAGILPRTEPVPTPASTEAPAAVEFVNTALPTNN